MNKKKLDEINEATSEIIKLVHVTVATSPEMRKRLDRITEHAQLIKYLSESLKDDGD